MTGTGRWHAVQPSAFPHEQEALDLLRAALPDRSPFRGWSNFEFIAEDGSINEVDALVLSADRIYLIECKAWSGEISGNQNSWQIRRDGYTRTEDNPLLLANRKAKKLKSLLERQSAFRSKKLRAPFIQAAVFLSARDCVLALDEIVRQNVHQRPDADRKGHWSIVDVMVGDATKADGRPGIGRDVERALCRAMEQLGNRRSTSASVGDYRLEKLISENDRYQDWLAVHKRLDSDRKRIRIFSQSSSAAKAEKRERKDLAVREYRLLKDVRHDGILCPHTLTDCETGPALIYDHVPDARRLDLALDGELKSAPIGARLDLIRQIAEALQYAHQRKVCHRALSPWTIDLVQNSESTHRALIRDWQSGSQAEGTRTETRMTLHAGNQAGLLIDPRAAVYAAPEVLSGGGYDAVSVDIFSLGALTYALCSGKHPAADPDELLGKIRHGDGLLISDAMDGAPESLQALVQLATDEDPSGRPTSVKEFLSLLDEVEEELTRPEPKIGRHPLDAGPGDELTHGFTVIERIGKGSTCVALAVTKDGQQAVLKVAKDPSQNERVRREADVLRSLRHPNIAKFLDEFEIDGLAAILMERAGHNTMDDRLRTEGRLSLDLLERFGAELLGVLKYLEKEGINHRDIKPTNIGIGDTRTKTLTLKLFDFSLSLTPAENTRAGTPPYLDPFLPNRKPPRWDLHAERFAAAMSLYEMATGTLPSWPGETGDPLATNEPVQLDVEHFDPAVRDALAAFFAKALHRDAKKRFDNADQMDLAWRNAFQSIDVPATDETESETGDDWDLSAVDGLGPATTLSALGLTPRLLNAADRIGATTVQQLLALPNIRLYRNRGIGQRVVRQLRELRDALAEQLEITPIAASNAESPDGPEAISVDRLVSGLTGIQLPEADQPFIQAWLGLDGDTSSAHLPTLRDAAERSACPRNRAPSILDTAVQKWRKNAWMTALRDQACEFISRREGIVTAEELATHLLSIRGSAANDGETRSRRAQAVVQAALECEASVESARFCIYRGERCTLVVATEQLGEAFAAASTARAQYAEALAKRAESLAKEEPLPSIRRIEEELATVPSPEADRPLSPDRRLRLAVAASKRIALSSRLELYPRGLSAERALRMGSNALLGPKRLTVQQLHARIHSRFPYAESLPERPALDELLKAVELPLVWTPSEDGKPAGYAPPSRGSGLTQHTSTLKRLSTLTHFGDDISPEAEAASRFEARIQRAVEERRVLIVSCPHVHIERAAAELCQRLKLDAVSAEKRLIDAMHQVANGANVDWSVVLDADIATPDTRDWRNLNALVRQAMPTVREHLTSAPKPLLVQHLGLLARYQQLDLIQTLRDAALNGMAARILLVPGDEYRRPELEGAVLPIVTPSDWAHLPRAWLENRHRGAAPDNEKEASA